MIIVALINNETPIISLYLVQERTTVTVNAQVILPQLINYFVKS